MKKFSAKLIVVMFILLFILPINVLATTNEPYKLFVNNQQIQIDSRVINDSIYFPAKSTAIALGVIDTDIVWNAVDQSVTITKNHDTVVYKVNSNIFMSNGNQVTMTNPPLIINGSLYVPVSYMAKAFHYEINLDEGIKAVVITIKPEIQEFIAINNEMNSIVSKMDKLLAQDTISENERLTIKSDVETMWAKLESWGQPLGYYSIKDLYFDTLTHGLTCCFNKCFLTDPKFSIINERIKNEYEQSSKKYSSDKNKIQAELNRIQQLNYL